MSIDFSADLIQSASSHKQERGNKFGVIIFHIYNGKKTIIFDQWYTFCKLFFKKGNEQFERISLILQYKQNITKIEQKDDRFSRPSSSL